MTKGATRVRDVPPDHLAALNAGRTETRTLAEGLAMDLAALAVAVLGVSEDTARQAIEPGAGITRRMAQAADLARRTLGAEAAVVLAAHPSDTVRGWAAYVVGADEAPSLEQRLAAIRPLADDPHFGVREWAWLAVRPALAADLPGALTLLRTWVEEDSPRLRRFAIESIRPRGVWCAHLAALKQDPEPARPLLDPLRADPERYVRDSVGNWLNDAAKSRPDWVRALCARWTAEDDGAATAYIVSRALRSI